MERIDRPERGGRGGRAARFSAKPPRSAALAGLQGKLPLIIAGVVILILLIVVLVLAFGNRQPANTGNTPVVPVTGLTDPTVTDDGGQQKAEGEQAKPEEAKVTAPESVKVTYKVAANTTVYAVINDNGTATSQVFNGGEEASFDVTGTWTFATWVTDGVTIEVDGQKASFDGKDATGMPMATVDYTAWLAKYLQDHPNAEAPAGVTLPNTGAAADPNVQNAANGAATNANAGTAGTTGATGQTTGQATGQTTGTTGQTGGATGYTNANAGATGTTDAYGNPTGGTASGNGQNATTYGYNASGQYVANPQGTTGQAATDPNAQYNTGTQSY